MDSGGPMIEVDRRSLLKRFGLGALALAGARRESAGSNPPKHVVFLLADQLRADCLGCYGNPIVQSPHIDGLARRGTRFTSAFAQHPQCVPSRSAMLTGRYPHVNGATSNYTAMTPSERTFPEELRSAGYRSVATGKLHIFADKARAAFTETMLSGGQRSGAISAEVLGDGYVNWMKEHGHWPALEKAYRQRTYPAYKENFQAHVSPLDPEVYVDGWVGNRSVEYIQQQPADEPLFLFVGFPNPHNPFEPPEPYVSMYDPAEMPIPASFREDLTSKPPRQLAYKRRGRRGYDYEQLSEAQLRRVIAYYYASITLVDDQVGKIVQALDDRRILDDTLIVFSSDHGEFLGRHGLLQKGIDEFPMLYDDLIHVPLIIDAPGAPGGRVVGALVETMDICPTVLDWAGLEVRADVQGHSLLPSVMGEATPNRRFILSQSGAVKALRGRRFKLVHYPGQPYGELYDLADDPGEVRNLYDSPSHRGKREEMTRLLVDHLIASESPRQGESLRGPAYWRMQYRIPFEDDARESEEGANEPQAYEH